MKKLILSTIFLFALSIAANAQCADEADCRAKLSEASSIINKVLDVNKTQAQAIEALKAENEARKAKEQTDKGIIEAQERLIALLEKERRKSVSFFFGLVKIKY